MHMKKRSFQKSMLMGNTAVVTLVVVVLFICANLYLIHEDAKRIQQQTESNASSILEQIRTTIDGVNEICLQLSANSYIIRIFEGLPNLEGNVFEKSPELDAQTKAFMWSYLIKKDSLHTDKPVWILELHQVRGSAFGEKRGRENHMHFFRPCQKADWRRSAICNV